MLNLEAAMRHTKEDATENSLGGEHSCDGKVPATRQMFGEIQNRGYYRSSSFKFLKSGRKTARGARPDQSPNRTNRKRNGSIDLGKSVGLTSPMDR